MVSVRNLRRRTVRSVTPARRTPPSLDSSPSRSPIAPRSPPIDYKDPYSPYALSNSDNPGNVIVNEVLDGTNYSSWTVAMFTALDAKNKIVFIDGSLPRPLNTDKVFRYWSRCNSMVKSWLLNSVNKEIYKSILHFNDSSEIWKDLMARFHITNLPRTYQLTQKLWSLQQGSMTLSQYYTALKTLWADLENAKCLGLCHNCSCCKIVGTTSANDKIIRFLAGLNDSYSTIRSQIIMMKTIPDLAEVYNLLDQDHSQRSIGSSSTTNAATFNVSVTSTEQASVNAAQSSHHHNPKQSKIQCSHCGYPPGYKSKQKSGSNDTSKPVVANVAVSDNASIGPNDIAELVNGMSKTQIQDIIAYFSNQLQTPSAQPVTAATIASTSANIASTSAVDINGSAPIGNEIKFSLPKSPIRLRSRQVLHSSLQTPPPGSQKPRRLSDVNLNTKPQFEYSSISSEIHALAKMVKDEFAEEENRKKSGLNLENLATNSVPVFERGRFYEEYSAKRNERLRRKKGEEAVEGGVFVKGTPYNLGVNHEPMTNKRRGTTAKKESLKKTVVSMVETATPRYSLRSMSKENRKPPVVPLNVAVSAMKTVTTRRGRRI